MSLTTYTGLLAAIASWLMRDDLTAHIPDFVSLAEADMAQRLRLRSMIVRAVATLDEDYETLPSDYVGMYSLMLDDEELMYAPAALMPGLALDWQGDVPMYYSIIGEQLQVAPAPASTSTALLRMTYYARPTPLSATVQSNGILAVAPQLYLYGSLLQSAPFLGDDARVQTWGSLYTQAAELLQASDDSAEYPAPLVIRSSSGDMTP